MNAQEPLNRLTGPDLTPTIHFRGIHLPELVFDFLLRIRINRDLLTAGFFTANTRLNWSLHNFQARVPLLVMDEGRIFQVQIKMGN